MKKFLFFLCMLGMFHSLYSQDSLSKSPIIFIYDASGSMWGRLDGKTKMEIASEVLTSTVNKLDENQKIGLVAYGHRKKGDCRDVEFLANSQNTDKAKVNQAVKAIKPLGKTPLAYSATLVIDQLRESGARATIILVTDGIESCDGDICDVVRNAKAEGIEFKLHIVGFGLKDGEKEQLQCAANAGEGNYYDADGSDALADVLQEATQSSVDEPAGNFSVYAFKNGEPLDAIFLAYPEGAKDEIGEVRTYRDTGLLYLPPGKYTLEVRALENADLAPIYVEIESRGEGTNHQSVSFDGGTVLATAYNNEEGWDATVQLYHIATDKRVASSRTYQRSSEMEVNPGWYRAKFQALVLEGLETTYIRDSLFVAGGSTVEISHTFHSGIARIGVTVGGELSDATVNIHEVNSKKNVAGSRTYTSDKTNPTTFILNPGTYQVKITTLGKHKGHKDEFNMTIKTGETFEKILSF